MTKLPNNLISRRTDGLKVVFFGTPVFAQVVLEKLIDSPFRPQLVVTAPDAKVGRGQKVQFSPVKQTAVENGIEVSQPKTLNSHFPKGNETLSILNSQFDFALLVAYGHIIPKEILSIPKYGFVNIHPSLLPKYRGPSPIQSVILEGEETTGVTVMLLDEQLDHGPILAQQEIAISPTDTHHSLSEKLANVGAEILLKALPEYLKFVGVAPAEGVPANARRPATSINHSSGSGTRTSAGTSRRQDPQICLPPKPQNHKKATFTKHIEKEDGYIDPQNPPGPKVIDRMVRAYFPWPGVWAEVKWKVEGVSFSDEKGKWKVLKLKFLPNNRTIDPSNLILIQPEGKRAMSIVEFKNGYPDAAKQLTNIIDKLKG